MCNGLRYIVHTDKQWCYMPNDLPPWYTVYEQMQRWMKAGMFEDMVHHLRMLMHASFNLVHQPSAAVLDRSQDAVYP